MEDGDWEDASAFRDFGKQQPVMATVREKGKQTWRETCLQLQQAAAGGRRREGGREGFPDSALSPLRSSGAPGLGSASKPPRPALLGGCPQLVYGEGYSSSALVIASLILLLHPCGMPG